MSLWRIDRSLRQSFGEPVRTTDQSTVCPSALGSSALCSADRVMRFMDVCPDRALRQFVYVYEEISIATFDACMHMYVCKHE